MCGWPFFSEAVQHTIWSSDGRSLGKLQDCEDSAVAIEEERRGPLCIPLSNVTMRFIDAFFFFFLKRQRLETWGSMRRFAAGIPLPCVLISDEAVGARWLAGRQRLKGERGL